MIGSEWGGLVRTYKERPDKGVAVNGNGIAAPTLDISTSTTLPQATKSSAYQATLAASGGTGPYTFSLAAGSSLPLGLTLSSTGLIRGTLDPSVGTGGYPVARASTACHGRHPTVHP